MSSVTEARCAHCSRLLIKDVIRQLADLGIGGHASQLGRLLIADDNATEPEKLAAAAVLSAMAAADVAQHTLAALLEPTADEPRPQQVISGPVI